MYFEYSSIFISSLFLLFVSDPSLGKLLFEFLEVNENKALANEIQVLPKKENGDAARVADSALISGSSISKRMSGHVSSGSQSMPPRAFDVPLGH